VDSTQVLNVMRAYFAGKQPSEVMDSFAQQSPRALLKESLDIVDFVVYLEEELGREIDMGQVGNALFAESFTDLAAEVSRILSEG